MLENIVVQELFFQINRELVSWTEESAELEFLITNGADIIPLEVKSAARNRRSKVYNLKRRRWEFSVDIRLFS
jgi:predicted AAA+ superfamily ATPase